MKPISILARGTMAALTLLLIGTTACTDSHDPLNPDQGTQPAAGVTSLIAPKPGYTPLPTANTRTATTNDGAWQTGDQVRASITFYTDDEGTTPVSLDAKGNPLPVEQTLTYTAPPANDPNATGQWSAAPSVVVIAPAARSMRVAYTYIGLPDALTATREQITGYVTRAKGTAVKDGEVTFESTATDRLIPIANVTGTLALTTAFERRSALVSLALQPGQTVHLTTATAQPDITAGSDGLYLLPAAVPATAAPATAHFHLQATDATTFTLHLEDVEKTAYKDVPLRTGWKYALDARNITSESGSGGENQQFVTASGMEPLDPSKFNADNPVWIITGGAGSDEDAAVVALNVRGALGDLPEGTSNIELVLADVTAVVDRALRGRPELRSVHAPVATSIEEKAFADCTALTTISLPQATSIGNEAFAVCTALATVSLPQATGTIGEGAFGSCAALTTVSLPQATGIGNNAFYGCEALETVTLPQATGIGNQAFDGCKALATVTLPKATGIGNQAFDGCKALATVTLPKATGTIGDKAFYQCEALKTVTLPLATGIGGEAFFGCEKLTDIELPAATNIGSSAFRGCTALADVSLPQAMNIGGQAFANCAKLATLSLPQATGIGEGAFFGCPALIRLELSAAGNFELDADPFYRLNTAACTLLLNTDKKAGGTGTPNASVSADGKPQWGTDEYGNPLPWLAIQYVASPATGLPGVGEGGTPW